MQGTCNQYNITRSTNIGTGESPWSLMDVIYSKYVSQMERRREEKFWSAAGCCLCLSLGNYNTASVVSPQGKGLYRLSSGGVRLFGRIIVQNSYDYDRQPTVNAIHVTAHGNPIYPSPFLSCDAWIGTSTFFDSAVNPAVMGGFFASTVISWWNTL